MICLCTYKCLVFVKITFVSAHISVSLCYVHISVCAYKRLSVYVVAYINALQKVQHNLFHFFFFVFRMTSTHCNGHQKIHLILLRNQSIFTTQTFFQTFLFVLQNAMRNTETFLIIFQYYECDLWKVETDNLSQWRKRSIVSTSVQLKQ